MNSSRLRHLLTVLHATSMLNPKEYAKAVKCYRKYTSGLPLTPREHSVLTYVMNLGDAMFPLSK